MTLSDLLKPLTAVGALCLLTACGDSEKKEAASEAVDPSEAATSEPAAASESELALETADQKLSYAIGYQMASHYSNDDILELDSDLLMRGIEDALDGKEKQVSDEESQIAGRVMQERMQTKRAAEAEVAKAGGVKFLEANKSKSGVTTTASGLQYEVISKGDSDASPSAEDTVTVHYHGTLVDESVFDSSVQRGEPATFALNAVIPGWTEGLQLMHEGDKFRFFIPSELGYGDRAQGSIPAHAVLIFEVELIKVGAE